MQSFKRTPAVLIAIFVLAPVIYGLPSGTNNVPKATVVLNEQFFNSFLEAIFNNLKAPSAQLAITPGDRDGNSSSYGCPSVVVLERENSQVKTAVKLEQGRILAPLAFSGSYSSTLLGCFEFRGWANTQWHLSFDKAAQVLEARIQIINIQLEGVPSLAQGSLTRLVQLGIDQQINPLKILRVDQISGIVPIAPSGGSLKLRAKEIEPEPRARELYLRVTYEFLKDS